MDDRAVRYSDTVLIDDSGERQLGDFLIHSDGTWSESNGDEDVQTTIDGSSRLLTRTFQNWHTHMAMSLNARDFSDGFPLKDWLEKAVFPTEARITPKHVRIGTYAAAAEMIRTGTSFAADMYFFPAIVAEVIDDVGIRALCGGPVSDVALPSHPSAESALAELDGLLSTNGQHSRIDYAISTHSVYLCSEETLTRARDLAEKHDAVCHIHVAETRKEVADCYDSTGMYPAEYLDSLEFMRPDTICAHSSWVKKSEIAMMAERGVVAVHCPTSNMKLACGGTLSLPAFQSAGVEVRLGTDGPASSGSGLDMRVEAKFASLVQRHDHWDATLLPARDVFALATKGSQDWVAWNLDDIRMRPLGRSSNRHLANLIFSGADCLDMWVEGKAVRRDGKTMTLDESKVIEDLDQIVDSYFQDLE
ncbi:MAG TPA: amidohydrolase [Candidatus Poseidoniales archaeon]|nr:MAG: chlorohydrolase [Euryarchaeota archaeon]HIA39400.1 amidohydrolase [Candidatus Poseidoniales archaeon]PXY74538.1 MAG: chlorohydrolase [Euryarchaeota archaeon]HIA90188.1 amidohydrolase [Candidatus Poseidoniales archaeon]HIB59720.1 amidohydrolase [Candidatus Poseidoniales archaeon]